MAEAKTAITRRTRLRRSQPQPRERERNRKKTTHTTRRIPEETPTAAVRTNRTNRTNRTTRTDENEYQEKPSRRLESFSARTVRNGAETSGLKGKQKKLWRLPKWRARQRKIPNYSDDSPSVVLRPSCNQVESKEVTKKNKPTRPSMESGGKRTRGGELLALMISSISGMAAWS